MMTLLLRSSRIVDVPEAKRSVVDHADLILYAEDREEVARYSRSEVIAYGRTDLMRAMLEKMSRPAAESVLPVKVYGAARFLER